MKFLINRRNFILSTLGSTVATLTPTQSLATPIANQEKKRHPIRCGKMSSVDLRKYYTAKESSE